MATTSEDVIYLAVGGVRFVLLRASRANTLKITKIPVKIENATLI